MSACRETLWGLMDESLSRFFHLQSWQANGRVQCLRPNYTTRKSQRGEGGGRGGKPTNDVDLYRGGESFLSRISQILYLYLELYQLSWSSPDTKKENGSRADLRNKVRQYVALLYHVTSFASAQSRRFPRCLSIVDNEWIASNMMNT